MPDNGMKNGHKIVPTIGIQSPQSSEQVAVQQ